MDPTEPEAGTRVAVTRAPKDSSPPSQRRPLNFADEVVRTELERLIADAGVSLRAAEHTWSPDVPALEAVLTSLTEARHALLASKVRWPIARRRARAHAVQVARRCREDLYLYLDEQRIRADLPRLREQVQRVGDRDTARAQAYVQVLDRMATPTPDAGVEDADQRADLRAADEAASTVSLPEPAVPEVPS